MSAGKVVVVGPGGGDGLWRLPGGFCGHNWRFGPLDRLDKLFGGRVAIYDQPWRAETWPNAGRRNLEGAEGKSDGPSGVRPH